MEDNAKGTMWDPSWKLPDKHKKHAVESLHQAIALFPQGFFKGAEGKIDRAARKMEGVELDAFRPFHHFLNEEGAPEAALGPDNQAIWATSPMHASIDSIDRHPLNTRPPTWSPTTTRICRCSTPSP